MIKATPVPPQPLSYSFAMLCVRAGLGVIFMFHGSQKLFGLFGGGGLDGLSQMLGPVTAHLVGTGEFFGGLAVLVGLLSRFSAGIHVLIMLGAISMVHAKNGFALSAHGYEFNVALIALALPVVLVGPGGFSLSRFLPRALKPWLE